jgi:hypothetical protein
MNNQRLGANSSIPRMKSFWENEAEKERIEAVNFYYFIKCYNF